MTKEEKDQYYCDLCDELYKHRYRYYVLSTPIISDYEYDMLERKLKEFEEKNTEYNSPTSPTKVIGSSLEKDYPRHIIAGIRLEKIQKKWEQ